MPEFVTLAEVNSTVFFTEENVPGSNPLPQKVPNVSWDKIDNVSLPYVISRNSSMQKFRIEIPCQKHFS